MYQGKHLKHPKVSVYQAKSVSIESTVRTSKMFDGDILLPIPSWVSYAPQAIIGRNKTHWIKTTSSNNWFPTAQQIENIVQLNKNKNHLLFLN